MLDNKSVKDFLKEIEVEDLVLNLQIMGDKIILDMKSHSPALHEKKKLEMAMKTAFQEKFPHNPLQLKIEVITEAKPNVIKGKEIPGIKNIIAIASGKGGVGKSTLTANLAISLQQKGFKVGILDADIYGPSQPKMFGVEDQKPRSVHIEGKDKMQPVNADGILLLSIGFFSGANQAVVWRGPMASKAIHQMLHDAAWGELDFLLIDLPPGTGDIHLSIVQEIPITGAIIVSTPQNMATIDARKGVAMFQMDSIQVPVLGIVENMAYFTPKELPGHKYYIFGEKGASHLAKEIGLPFLGEIPLIQSIRESADFGTLQNLLENQELQTIYQEIVDKVLDELHKRNKSLPATKAVEISHTKGCSP